MGDAANVPGMQHKKRSSFRTIQGLLNDTRQSIETCDCAGEGEGGGVSQAMSLYIVLKKGS